MVNFLIQNNCQLVVLIFFQVFYSSLSVPVVIEVPGYAKAVVRSYDAFLFEFSFYVFLMLAFIFGYLQVVLDFRTGHSKGHVARSTLSDHFIFLVPHFNSWYRLSSRLK